jgi:hypothetical protein
MVWFEAERTFRVQTGEKAAFWLTVFFWTRADGQLPIPPFVVHQAEEMSEFLCLNLPADWGVHCASSGYMDAEGWRKVTAHFLMYCPPARPVFTFFDGAEGHFDKPGLQQLLDSGVYCFFLRSHGSVSDQANDNGPNAKWHACYARAYEHWNQQYGTVTKLNRAFANEILAEAWSLFMRTAAGSVIDAYKKTGLHPLNRAASNHVNGSAMVALPFTTPPPASRAPAAGSSGDGASGGDAAGGSGAGAQQSNASPGTGGSGDGGGTPGEGGEGGDGSAARGSGRAGGGGSPPAPGGAGGGAAPPQGPPATGSQQPPALPPPPGAPPGPAEGTLEWYQQENARLVAENAALQRRLLDNTPTVLTLAPAPGTALAAAEAPGGAAGGAAPAGAQLSAPEMLLRAGAWAAVNTSLLIPLQKMQEVLDVQHLAKKRKLGKGHNPSTVTGLVVTGDVLRALEESTKARADDEAAAAERAKKRKTDADERSAQRLERGSAVLSQIRAAAPGAAQKAAVEKLNKEDLQNALRRLHVSINDPGTSKELLKAPLVAALLAALTQQADVPAGAADAPAPDAAAPTQP